MLSIFKLKYGRPKPFLQILKLHHNIGEDPFLTVDFYTYNYEGFKVSEVSL